MSGSAARAVGADDPERARLRQANQELTERVWALEQQTHRLTTLYVASQSLHETLERTAVVRKIGEIVINLLGCEEFAIFEREGREGPLRLVASTGVDPEPLRTLELGRGAIGRAALSGQVLRAGLQAPVEERLPFEEALTACIPLAVDQRPTGAIALFSLLPQKLELEPLDAELFELLTRQGGAALHAASLASPR